MSFNHHYPFPQSSSSSAAHYSLSPDQIKELMELQMQRDFLEKHAKFIAKQKGAFLPDIKDTSLDEGMRSSEDNYQRHKSFLHQQIQAYRHYVQSSQYSPSYTQLVLLPKKGSEEAGISRNLGEHFAQLQRIPAVSIPFVELSFNGGLCFYWNSAEEAAQFQNALSAHQIPTIAIREQLPGYQNQYLQYKTAQTMAVKVPHRYIEALLSVAQYHPYSYEKVINDLYQGKMDRTEAILAEVAQSRTPATATQESFVAVNQVDRLPLSQEKDLIAIEIGSCKPTVEKDTPHLVLVLDDSGSMSGKKIDALNSALRTLIHSLDDHVLVSIQPLNCPTIAQRKPARELKEYLPAIRATGGTPLLETIAGSAAHFRAHPLDLVIPQAEFNRTTMVVLTDGLPNGGPSDTVDKLVTYMRDSRGLASCARIGTRKDFHSIDLSFGSGAVPCTQLPVVLGFSIGADGDTQFMQDLAQRFSTPQGFIRTEEEIDEDMSQAVCLVQQMQGRHEKAFVGISYTDGNGRLQANGLTLRNLFYGFSRRVFFTVPRNSPVTTALIHDTNAAVGSCSSGYTQNSLLINEYVRNEFEDIKAYYAKQSKDPNAIPGFDEGKVIQELGIECVNAPSGGRRSVSQEGPAVTKKQADYGNDHQAWSCQENKLRQLEQRRQKAIAEFNLQNPNTTPLQKLKEDSARKIDVLMGYLSRSSSALIAEMQLYKDIELFNTFPQSQGPHRSPFVRGVHSIKEADTKRKAVAQFSQERHIGVPMNNRANASASLKDLGSILAAIEKTDIMALQNFLDDISINAVAHQTGGTALHAVLFHMKTARERNELARMQQLEAIAYYLINHPGINFCQQDKRGSTAAHNAAWWGFPHILIAIIGKANERGQLEPLLRVRNHQHVGGTTVGESLADNVRLSPKGQDFQKQLLLRALTLNTAVCNQHTEPYWNTTLMDLLSQLRNIADPRAKAQQRKVILDYIERNKADLRFQEANFSGNTALHFAFWNQEYTIGLAILNAAKAQGNHALQDVLAARNNVAAHVYGGGEVPHMNLVAQMLLLEKEETLNAVLDLFWYVDARGMQFDIGDGQRRSIQEILKGDPINGRIQVLKSILAMNIMPAQMNERIQKWILQLETLECFMKTQSFIATHLDDKGKAELGRLYTVYQKQIEGYCGLNFLIQAPIVQLQQDYAQLKAIQQLPEALRALVAELEQIRLTMNPNSMKAACETIVNWQRSNPINPNSLSSTSALHAQLTRTLIHLSLALSDQKQAHFAAVPVYVPPTLPKHFPPPPPLPHLSPSQPSYSSNSNFGSGYSQSSSSNLPLPQQNASFFSSGGIPASQPPVPSHAPPPLPIALPQSQYGSSQSSSGASSSFFGSSAMSPNYVDLAAQNLEALTLFFRNHGVAVQVFSGKDKSGYNNYYVWSNDADAVKTLSNWLQSAYNIGSQSNLGSPKFACPPAQHCNAWHIILTDADVAKLPQQLMQTYSKS